MYLFVDTETTGVPNFKLDILDPAQPRILQLAAHLYTQEGVHKATVNRLIKPEGFVIDESSESGKINSITQAKAEAEGVPILQAMQEVDELAKEAIGMVAHSMTFDATLIKREALGANYDMVARKLPRFCTQNSNTKIVMAPWPDGRKGFKWPSLQETYRHYFGKDLEKAHDAAADATACAEIFFAMKRCGTPIEFKIKEQKETA